MIKFIYSKKPKNFAKSSPYFWLQYIQSKVRGRFRKILWPSQNIWTLKVSRNAQFNFVLWGCTKLKLSLKLCTRSLRETREKGDRWAGWTIADYPPKFGTSVNPVATRKGGQIVPPSPDYQMPPRFSDLPTSLTENLCDSIQTFPRFIFSEKISKMDK